MGFFGALKSFVGAAIAKLPLFGKLREVPPEARIQAFYETLTTTIFATMPFGYFPSWAGSFSSQSPRGTKLLKRERVSYTRQPYSARSCT